MVGCRPFTDNEVQTLLDSFKSSGRKYAKRDRAWFAYGISSGFRITELMSLKIKDVAHYFQATGYAELQKRHTKGKQEGRTQVIEAWAVDIMQEWLDELRGQGLDKHNHLFQSQLDGDRPIHRNQAWEILINECSENGIYGNIGTHSMRKTFTNKIRIYYLQKYQEGEMIDPKKLLMKETGHKSEEALDRYLSFLHSNRDREVFSYKP